MLTADLVLARRRGTELRLVTLDDEGRGRARAIAERVVKATLAHVGRSREDLDDALEAIRVPAQEVRLRAGLAKLMTDRCTWDEDAGTAAPALRQALFVGAAAVRRALPAGARFDRAAVLDDFARSRGLDRAALEHALYADLRGAQTLLAVEPLSAPLLVDAWERGQAQAVLLRAVRITLDVRCASAGATRTLFHRLKFLRLLHTITATEHGHRIVIDGPFSLFESSTKYGLQLAMVLPVLDGCDSWSMQADVRWGKDRVPLHFRLLGRGTATSAEDAPLPEEVEQLKAGLEKRLAGWKVSAGSTILELPGIGLCVPDLTLQRGREKVHVEVMGFWSRDAVWRRVELVQSGLTAPILFAVSARLRVSEEVLGEDASSALYVYKGTMSARVVAERALALAERTRGGRDVSTM
ncbi:MAG TPA: DUF790 family protein [Polyangiaceae bacterium]|jgi:hypothetical protein